MSEYMKRLTAGKGRSGWVVKTLVVGAVVGLILLATLFLTRDAWMGLLRGQRAERLLVEAEAAFAVEDWETVVRTASAAHFLQPDNLDAPLWVARGLLRQRSGNSVAWWQQALAHPDLPIEDLQQMVELTLNSGMVDDSVTFLNRLIELDRNNVRTNQLRLRLMDMQRRQSQSQRLIVEMAQAGAEDWRIHERYISLRQHQQGDAVAPEVVSHLMRLMETGGELSISAARELVSMTGLDEPTRIDAAEYLLAHSEDNMDHLFSLTIKQQAGLFELDEIRQRALQSAQTARGLEMDGLAIWASWAGEFPWFENAVSWQEFSEAGGRMEIYLQGLLNSGNPRRVLAIVESIYEAQDPEAALMLYFRAQAQSQLGNAEAAEASLRLAVNTVHRRTAGRLEALLLQEQRYDLLLELFRQEVRQNPNDPLAVRKLIAVLYEMGEFSELRERIQRVNLEDFAQTPEVASFIAYLMLMLDHRTLEVHTFLERYLVQYPELFDHQLVLAVSYLIMGNRQAAVGFLRAMPQIDHRAPRFLRVSAAILGRYPAEQIINLAEYELLLPRELYLLGQAQSNR